MPSLTKPAAPAQRPVSTERFGDVRVDEFAWLRDREDPAVFAWLEAERAYAEAVVDARAPGLRERLYAEMRGRMQEADSSVPTKDGPWLYYSRTELGDEYPRHCRRPAGGEGPEQLFLDENELAAEHDYFDLEALVMSPNHGRCAYTVDLDGDELYTIEVLDLERGVVVDRIEDCSGVAWIDDEWLIYTRRDDTHRPWRAWRHQVGSPVDADVCVFEELDPAFFVSVYRTRSNAYVVLSLDSQVSSEQWLLATKTPEAAPRLVAARRSNVEYEAMHHVDAHGRERLLVRTNAGEGAQNFRVMLAAVPGDQPSDQSGEPWREFMPARADVLIEDLDVFAERLVVWERVDGLPRLRIVPLALDPDGVLHSGAGEHCVEFPDPTYSLWSGSNPEFHATHLQFVYTSLTTPTSVYDYDPRDRSRTLRKRTAVVGGHEPERYASARVWATAADGEQVPISLVWKRDGEGERPASPRPLLLEAYGAYGITSDPSFSSARLSLLDRAAIYAIAHVRGGEELGRRWYEAGKLEHKHNSFGDYIACAEHLIRAGWTTPAQLAGSGGSAGGLLIGVVANLRPELFGALIADVPFVDILNTMLDPTLPLVGVEREEWGDPRTEAGYRWIRAYAPYDNVRAQAYPAMFVTAGWNDPRVGYWEPAKWVARLRERQLDDRPILLWTNLDAGHGGASGRFEFLHELALEYAFLIDRWGPSRSGSE